MLTEWKSMATLSELTTAFPKEAMIQHLVDILENEENSTDHHRVKSDEQNTEIDLVGRAQEVAIDADRDHVAIATDPHRRTDHLADPEARSIPSRDP